MAEDSALSRHSELTARILADLLANGIARIDLCVEDYYDLDNGGKGIVNGFGEVSHNDFDQEFVHVVMWLEEEAFLRFRRFYSGTNGESCVSDCALTAKCLAALDVKIAALGGLNGKQVIEASKESGSMASNYVKAGSFLGGIFGGFISSAGG